MTPEVWKKGMNAIEEVREIIDREESILNSIYNVSTGRDAFLRQDIIIALIREYASGKLIDSVIALIMGERHAWSRFGRLEEYIASDYFPYSIDRFIKNFSSSDMRKIRDIGERAKKELDYFFAGHKVDF